MSAVVEIPYNIAGAFFASARRLARKAVLHTQGCTAMALSILTPEQRQQIQDRRRHTRERRISDRLLALLWLDDGQSQQQVAATLDVHRATVGEWVSTFRSHGLEELCTLHYQGDPGELSAEQIEQLKAEIHTGRFRSAKQVATWIRDTFQVDYSESGVKTLLHRVGATYHKTSGFLWKANPEAQQQFVQNYEADTAQKKGLHAATSWMGAIPFGASNACGVAGCCAANASSSAWVPGANA
jgi:transposase